MIIFFRKYRIKTTAMGEKSIPDLGKTFLTGAKTGSVSLISQR
jgi:hypothetical protein